MRIEKRKQLANLTSNILNPFLVGLAIILLLSFASASSTLDAIRWALISMALSILPVFIFVIYLVRNGHLEAVFTIFRKQRTKLYLLSGLCAVVSYVVLTFLKAPPLLVAAFTAGISTTVLFMCINLWWKISLHTAFVAGSVTVMVMLYGWTAAGSAVLVPLTAWSRVELEHHSLAQAIGGALLASVVAVVVLRPVVMA